jgi:hypothetical protein
MVAIFPSASDKEEKVYLPPGAHDFFTHGIP